MDRPYVICHMLTSLDGKIDGPFMSAPEVRPVAAEYGKLRTTFDCQATMYGTTTMGEVYAEGRAPALEPCRTHWPREDYAAQSDVDNYIVSVDPEGVLGWAYWTARRSVWQIRKEAGGKGAPGHRFSLRKKFSRKMVDYLKKALIYGHTSRISS